jgi:hypothetical protein
MVPGAARKSMSSTHLAPRSRPWRRAVCEFPGQRVSGAALDAVSRSIQLNSSPFIAVTLRDLTIAQADGQDERALHGARLEAFRPFAPPVCCIPDMLPFPYVYEAVGVMTCSIRSSSHLAERVPSEMLPESVDKAMKPGHFSVIPNALGGFP